MAAGDDVMSEGACRGNVYSVLVCEEVVSGLEISEGAGEYRYLMYEEFASRRGQGRMHRQCELPGYSQ